MAEIRKQEPSSPDNWLHDGVNSWQRLFRKLVYLGKDAEPWAECTTAEKISWEKSHPQPEPPEPEEE